MIYFVNTIKLKKGTYSCVDQDSPEYKAKCHEIDEKHEKFIAENRQEVSRLESKYPEFFEVYFDQDKEYEFNLTYGNDFYFEDEDRETDEYFENAELELEKAIFEKCGKNVQIKGNWGKYLCYTFEGPHPNYQEFCSIYFREYKGPFISSIDGPIKEESALFVELERTPVMFNSLEAAKEFVERNGCDWQECGYYNYADIQGVAENCCYPHPSSESSVTHNVYSVDAGWVECKVVDFDSWYTLEIEGLKVLKQVDGDFIGYNGSVEIG